MCNLTARYEPMSNLRRRFRVPRRDDEAELNLEPLYALRPTLRTPIVRIGEHGREIAVVRWDLVPEYLRAGEKKPLLTNARDDNLTKSPLWRRLMDGRRCLFPANAYYEWEKAGDERLPWAYVLKSREPFAFAALWDRGRDPKTGDRVESVALVTTIPNPLAAKVHDRMPAILAREDEDSWLSPDTTPDDARKLIRPYPEELMTAFRVSKVINSSKVPDSPELLQPLAA